MTRDKRKKRKDHATKKAVSKSQKASKQASKAERKDSRHASKFDDDGDEEDIEILIKQFQEGDRRIGVAEEVACEPPSPRANASWVAAAGNAPFVWLFGGEHCTGRKVKVYGELFKYRIDKKDWRRINTPVSPPPRSGHQTVVLTNGKLLVFGGEYTSPSQNQFHHWKDCWVFDPKELKWEQLDIPTPSARSGHRMTVWKNFVVLFGGFYDNYKTTKYHDDLWLFDTTEYKWSKVEFSSLASKPGPRSGFQFITHNDTIYLYGGYCKKQIDGDRESGHVYSDMWLLQMSADPSLITWSLTKKAGKPPPKRAGCTMIMHKNRGIRFGGVEDNEDDEDVVCRNDMYAFEVEKGRWFGVTIKSGKAKTDDPVAELDPAAETPAAIDPSQPHPRYNAMLATYKSQLILYGGLFEDKKSEHTLDDLWVVNLDKGGPWEVVQRGGWERGGTSMAALREAKTGEETKEGGEEEESGSDSDSSDSSSDEE
ncbi:uncharacterized protein EV422DRAFT_112068 [Fimicolochytrium jonesii]|uniref:uncharacterized protein n=1 Tax=Fimicolochytrium jonesii TaxID=1396493 RepID=UPI0022FE371B|nr:uncharacterized protein EV422DRAFT_112068 [Fimicolochytrium jonesii]KAI8819415.1 hypothetical protein EV422DRAFT_112068 [Fimicolochytrium jonesii]